MTKSTKKPVNRSVLWRNLFFVVGVVALGWMLWSIGWRTIVTNLHKTGWWFLIIISMWLPIYMINSLTMSIIMKDEEDPSSRNVSFFKILKINISGFALRSATPLGFLGSDPYKMLEFKNLVGLEKATSSVMLYTITNISAQLIFWTISMLVASLLPLPTKYRLILFVSFVLVVLLLGFLWSVFQRGLTVRLFHMLDRIPWLGKKVAPFSLKYEDKLVEIDHQIAYLYHDRRKAFWKALGLEFFARLCNALEIFVILRSGNLDGTVFQAIVVYAFMNVFTNILFFAPMQVGTREGGFMLALKALSFDPGLGVYVSLVTRARELVWIGIGMLLIKVKVKSAGEVKVPV